MRSITRQLIAAVAALAITLIGVSGAFAATAENARITNTATVTYDTATTSGNTAQASVQVDVQLVAAAPTYTFVSSVPAAPINVSEGATATLTYTLDSNANGSDTYSVGAADPTADTGVSNATVTYSVNGAAAVAGPVNVTLGGTTLAAAPVAGVPTITVPYDQSTDGDANGITDGDEIIIGGEVYTVAAGGVAAPVGELMDITLTANISVAAAAAASIGDIVGERADIDVIVVAGTLSAPPTAGDHAVTTGGDVRTVNVLGTALTITKEVALDAATFGAGPVNADYTDTLTYRITVSNTGGADATNVVITDPLPPFTSYVAASGRADTAAVAYAAAATTLDDDTAGAPDDGYDFNVTTANEVTYDIGTVTGGSTVVLFFQLTVQ